MKRRILTYFLFCLCLLCYSQNAKIDSLRLSLSRANEDTTKRKILNTLAERFRRMGMVDSARYYANATLAFAEKTNDKKGVGSAHLIVGLLCANDGNYVEALKHYYIAVKIQEETGNKSGMASSYNNIGNAFQGLGNLSEALKNNLTSLKIAEEIGDEASAAASLNNMGLIYIKQGDSKRATENYLKALDVFERIGNKRGAATTLLNIGNTYLDKEDYSNTLFYMYRSLRISKEIGDKHGVAGALGNIGITYYFKKEYTKALENYFDVLELEKELGEPDGLAIAYINIGTVYMDQKKYPDAEKYCLMSMEIAKGIGDLETIRDAGQALSQLYELTGRDMDALKCYKVYINARDSLTNEESTKKTVRLQMNYEFEKKEAETKLEQEKREAVSFAESRKQKIIIWSVCGILVLVFCFAVYAYRSYLQKQKANEAITKQKEIIEEKQKEILDSIYYARRIQRVLLTSEKYIQRNLNRLMGGDEK